MLKKDKSLIPYGVYCYTGTKYGEYTCPYWGKNTDYEDQESGYCTYLDIQDWNCETIPLLWDQVKECGINDPDWDDEE